MRNNVYVPVCLCHCCSLNGVPFLHNYMVYVSIVNSKEAELSNFEFDFLRIHGVWVLVVWVKGIK